MFLSFGPYFRVPFALFPDESRCIVSFCTCVVIFTSYISPVVLPVITFKKKKRNTYLKYSLVPIRSAFLFFQLKSF